MSDRISLSISVHEHSGITSWTSSDRHAGVWRKFHERCAKPGLTTELWTPPVSLFMTWETWLPSFWPSRISLHLSRATLQNIKPPNDLRLHRTICWNRKKSFHPHDSNIPRRTCFCKWKYDSAWHVKRREKMGVERMKKDGCKGVRSYGRGTGLTQLSSDPVATKRPQGEKAAVHWWQRFTWPSYLRTHLGESAGEWQD